MTEFKQVIVVRKDLNMSPGKLAVQVAHACVSAVSEIWDDPYVTYFVKWYDGGTMQRKIVLQVKDLAALEKFVRKLQEQNIPHFIVKDLGFTELEPNTVTCVGLPPLPAEVIDPLTKRLRLYS